MSAAPPRISVLMAVHNGLPYVQAAVASILAQTERDFEFLIMDDGSTDGTGEVLQSLAEQDQRVHYVRQEKIGLPQILNLGLSLAKGEFIARMDADDLALPDRFACELAYLDAHPECVAVGGQILQIDADGDPIGPFPCPLEHTQIEAELWRGRGSAIVQPTVLLRRSAVAAVGGYAEQFPCGEDLDLFLKLAEIGTLANLPHVVLHMRRHVASISANLEAAALRADAAREHALRAAQRRRGLPETPLQLQTFTRPKHRADLYTHWACRSASAGHRRTTFKYMRKLLHERQSLWITCRRLGRISLHLLAGLLPTGCVNLLRRKPASATSPSTPAKLTTAQPAASYVREGAP